MLLFKDSPYVYSFHNKLKTKYLNGKANRRIDFLVDTLLRIEQDNFFTYMRRKQLFEINYSAVHEAQRHVNGMRISVESIQVTEYSILDDLIILF